VPAAALRRLFDKSKFAISTEETRYYLNGVYMHVAEADGGRVLRCVATDGHRLARIDADLPEGAADMPGVIVPRKTVGELRKLLDDDDMKIAVSVSETKVRFATPDITLTSKVIDGTFPDYTRVIPQGNTRRMEVDAAEFAQAVDRVATVSSERCRRRRACRGLRRRAAGNRLQRQIPAGNRQPGGPRERRVPVQLLRRPHADARGQRYDGGLCRHADARLSAAGLRAGSRQDGAARGLARASCLIGGWPNAGSAGADHLARRRCAGLDPL
jgi:hypothetical protein